MPSYPPVGATVGRYRVTGVLGHGGMGIVYAAVRDDLDRNVALKVLSPELARDGGFRSRFAREAQILSRLYSPHIIDIYEYGEHDGCLYIASPLIEGGDLRHHLLTRGTLAPGEALHVAEQVARALADAHRAGVVHRDVKPGNVLLRGAPDGEVFAYLGDFGVAQSPDDERTPTSGLTGTLSHMAPERHLGSGASPASDIYSLGCLLFTMLTGGPPYDGTDVEMAAQHLRGPVPQVAGSGDVPRAVNRILRGAMAKDPEDRYRSAEALVEDLRRARAVAEAAGPRPAPLPAGPAPERRGGTRRTVRLAGRTVAALAVVVTIGYGVYTWSVERRACDTGFDNRGECLDPGRTGAPAAFTCWDGTPVALRSQCTDPAGLRGLQWVFPSFARVADGCELRADPTVDASLRSYRCEPPAGAPGAAVHYTEWLSSEAAATAYDRQFALPAVNFMLGDKAAGYQWWPTRPNDDGLFKTSVAYLHIPYSASVYAETRSELETLCAQVVARSPRTFRGEGLACSMPDRPRPRSATQNAF